MADDMNNDERDQTGASEGMPEDLKRLLARAEEQEEGAYNPDADSDEEDDDDEELEESFGANTRGEDAGTDINGGSLQISEFGKEMKQSFIEYSMSVIRREPFSISGLERSPCRSSPPAPCPTCATASSRCSAASSTR